MSDFRDTLYTINKEGKRRWVYPAVVRGFFFSRRTLVAYALMAVYLAMPWLTVGGKQAVFLDLLNREFTFFGSTFWATDTIYLFCILAILGLSLFFFTAVFGRVWCGWACPETVFLEFLFRPIEALLEGGPVERYRLDDSPWTPRKVAIKATKYLIYIACAWLIANTFLAYFVGRGPLLAMMTRSPLENFTPFAVSLFVMGCMIFQFGWFREQFCTVLCPYARFQSVLLDADSLAVSYDPRRGEPRGKMERGEDRKFGDCIDCGMCVRVCPTGIDIRNGLQLECIHCAACVDACDSIMAKVGRPLGLVRYDTENGITGKTSHFIRPRVVIYAVLLVVVIAALTVLLNRRELSDFQLLRGALDAPYQRLDQDRVSNHIHLKISNKADFEQVYELSVPERADLEMITPLNPLKLAPHEIRQVPLFINFNPALVKGDNRWVRVRIIPQGQREHFEKVRLVGPDE